jgi:small subunit ribosomal protein S9
VARVRVCPGTGIFQVNGRELEAYFGIERHRRQATMALAAANVAHKVDVFVNVKGGGPTGQAGATIMGVARALVSMDESLGPVMRSQGLLTRDARKVERKKYGRRGARRSFQFSKR